MTPDQTIRLQQRLGVTPDGSLGKASYAALFNRLAGKPLPNAEAFGRGAAKHFPAYEITTGLRLAHFMAQIHVESCGFTRLTENLNYSAKRLQQVWPQRFPTSAAASAYANNLALLAEKVYGGRMGNLIPRAPFTSPATIGARAASTRWLTSTTSRRSPARSTAD